MKDTAIVVFSGGQDSTTCLYWALKNFAVVETISFDYGQKHKIELEQASTIAGQLKVKHTILDLGLLNQLAPNALTRDNIDVEKYGEKRDLPNTFVDGRNMLFLTFTAVLAKQRGIRHIVTGVSQTDFSGYPDCRNVFIKSLNVTLDLAMDYQFEIHTPLMWLSKAQTWELADQLGCFEEILHNTVTCYNGIIGAGCGECPACVLRARGLEEYLQSRTT